MVNLKKGSSVSLMKEAHNSGISDLNKVGIGLGWDISKGHSSFDLDAWVLPIENGKALQSNLVYFARKVDKSGYIKHKGDNLTGIGKGDDETIMIELSKLPQTYTNIVIGVTIYNAYSKRQSFKMVDNTFIRIYDAVSKKEICKYADEFKDGSVGECATMVFGILTREPDNSWRFDALGEGSKTSSFSKLASVSTGCLQYINDRDSSNTTKSKDVAVTVNQSIQGVTTVTPNNNKNQESRGKRKMAVSLSKGNKVSLAKVASDAGIATLSKITVGLGWDVNRYSGGGAFDLDASVFCCGGNGKVRTDSDFIFYNNKTSADGAIVHAGDNRTGEGDGDDESINIDLTRVDPAIEKIDFTVTIDQADVRNQSFGMVENSYIRIVDAVTGTELLRYDLGEDYSCETALVVAELYRHNGEWKFNAIGSGFAGGLAALCGNFGVEV